MFCMNCGVRLADTEKKCPLCGTAAYHPEIERKEAQPLYPGNKVPCTVPNPVAVNITVLAFYLVPVLVTFLIDWEIDRELSWFGYVLGAIALAYVVTALPSWFGKPNPVIFVPCDFAAAALYLLYICLNTGGSWYLSFALPVVVSVCLVASALTVLLRYMKRGRLYIWGGFLIALGGLAFLVEILVSAAFDIHFVFWSVYPLSVLLLFGVLLIYLAVNGNAREMMERKFFF